MNECQFLKFVKKNKYDNVKQFIEEDGDINCVDINNNTALMIASLYGYMPMIQMLVESGADINKFNSNHISAIDKAIRGRHINVIKYLIDNNVLVETSDPLIIKLAKMDEEGIIGHLLKKSDINVNAVNKEGKSAIFHSVKNKNIEDITLLIKNGASTDITDNNSHTFFHYIDEEFASIIQKIILDLSVDDDDVPSFAL